MLGELNKDQLDGLARLCFDLAKGAFATILLPAFSISDGFFFVLIRVFVSIIAGIAFASAGLILLKQKEKVLI